jgi:hypothetical protein
MKQSASIYAFMAATLFLAASCYKTRLRPEGTASLTLINAVVGADSLVTNFNKSATLPGYYINANMIVYNNYGSGPYSVNNYQLSAYAGSQQLMIYKIPDTFPKSEPLYDLTLDLPVGSINTFFMTGTTAAPDTLFTRDYPRNHPVSDSVTGIRFVNLSPGSQPISINIQGGSPGSEVSSIPYKGITSFKDYPATHDISSYTFEFRDAATGELLASFLADGININGSGTLESNKWRYRNCTLALLGLPGGTDATAQTVLLINNY